MERSVSCVLLLLCGLWSSVCPVALAINETVGRDVTLTPHYTGDPSEINWKINGNKLVDMELRPRVDIVFYHLQDRATINHTDGVLTIRKLTKGDSGVYKAEVLVNNVYQVTEINLMVLDESVTPAFTSSTGPPNIHVTSPSFSRSHGPPETKKTKSHTEGPSSRITTHSTKVKQSGMSASTRTVILVVFGLVVMGVILGCLLWCFCSGKKRKQTYNTTDLYTAGLLGAEKSEETEAGNDVKSGVRGSSLDASETESEVGDYVQPEEDEPVTVL
ncbi:uncharacterized protein LOC120921614 isoform X3 [Rana temporaria]|uniref:uncharacterized protein LOC120921614 isoform X3 n=1 Tax=Rana temporaria TaxID=8407 RepID=UPI001AADD6EB|nr:uncharacterized protein LOC120921614 isoform X3 [Rana temporaria]